MQNKILVGNAISCKRTVILTVRRLYTWTYNVSCSEIEQFSCLTYFLLVKCVCCFCVWQHQRCCKWFFSNFYFSLLLLPNLFQRIDFSMLFVTFLYPLCVLHAAFRFLLDDGALYLSDKVHAKEIDVKKSEISMIYICICMCLYVICTMSNFSNLFC